VNFARSSRQVRARGKSWPSIALEHSLSVRRCQQIVEQWREDGLAASRTIDPLRETHDLLDLLAQAVDDYATLEQRTKHDAVQLGARKQKLEAAFARFDLLQLLGLIPRPAAITAERGIQDMFREWAQLAEEFDVPRGYLEAVLNLAERGFPRRGAALEAAA
jgi:hypothetical protein